MLLDGGIHPLVFGVYRLQFDFQPTDGLAGNLHLAVEVAPLQGLQLGLEPALFFLIVPVFFCSLGLALQVLQRIAEEVP